MQTHFLLGPAGSGKTFRCLAEIRAALAESPEGPPLILLAPKQATFQLERQLLADPTLHGYTRLHILSFERLAQFVLDALGGAPPPSLNDQGRVMVLRALLMRHEHELKLFHKSARRPGFAQQLSELLGELQQHQFNPAKLRALAQHKDLADDLRDKLHDLALLLAAYEQWLAEHELQDGNRLLDTVTDMLRGGPTPEDSRFFILHSPFFISGLWLDGFAEMTPQELDLLVAVLPFCARATLAFCLEESSTDEGKNSWLSIWSVVRKTYQECRRRIEALADGEVRVEQLAREGQQNRFADNPILRHLENGWARPGFGARRPVGAIDGARPGTVAGDNSPADKSGDQSPHSKAQDALRMVDCANPDAEATFAAREILRFVRSGGRFRDAAVLVRNLDGYHKPLERAFRRYEIPFFLDRREAVAHHPLAELTRSALRTVAFGWQHEDWFAALKTGFSHVEETDVDRLENEALARGWRGAKWTVPLPISNDPALEKSVERLRQELVPPFADLEKRLDSHRRQPTGAQLAEALRKLWENLKVEKQLQAWADDLPENPQSAIRDPQSAIHLTVWEQMNAWLDNLELAFPREPLPLRDWLPILEAGLANLTVGVIPPALDQVLIGAIDRSRNPELKLALVLGLNEGIFPAAPAAPNLLNDADREALSQRGQSLGPDLRDRVARERYLGYIACTRASQRLVATFSRHDAVGKTLNPSLFVSHLQRLFPELEVEQFDAGVAVREAEHVCELVAALVAKQPTPDPSQEGNNATRFAPLQGGVSGGLLELPALKSLAESLRQLRDPLPTEQLSPELAEKLFGPVLRTSVSRLEEFAACPFRYFVRSGLRAEERKLFELDPREQGSFQHEVLKVFDDQLRAENKRWRDLTPPEACKRVGRIAAALTADYRDGLLRDTEQSRFTAQVLTESLQDFIEVLVGWMREQYEFEPAAVELGFGSKSKGPTPDPSQEGKRQGRYKAEGRKPQGTLELFPSWEGSGVGPSEPPAWEIQLGNGHKLILQGRIDRVDLCREPGSDSALCVVMDYKSSQKHLDPILMLHGVQLQLLGYLSVLRHWPDPRKHFGVAQLIPAGVFYVNLRGQYQRGGSRTEALADADAARKLAYRHTGKFDASFVRKLDRRPNVQQGDQFNYRLNNDGSVRARSPEALEHAQFEKLLDNVEAQLKAMGRRILAGETGVDPYRKSGATPCEYCDYAMICRIDPWTHRYRVLAKADEEESS